MTLEGLRLQSCGLSDQMRLVYNLMGDRWGGGKEWLFHAIWPEGSNFFLDNGVQHLTYIWRKTQEGETKM